jgi:hypothetical protein
MAPAGRFDLALDALGHPHRRRILRSLLRQDPHGNGHVSASGLRADGLLEVDPDADHVGTTLYHVHLPKLDEAGYVTWDRHQGTVERGPRWDEVAPLVRLLSAHADDLPDGWV